MPKVTYVIRFDVPGPTAIHKIRNWAEEFWSEHRNTRGITMGDIDTVVDEFQVTVTKAREIRAVKKALTDTLDKHFLLEHTHIEEN